MDVIKFADYKDRIQEKISHLDLPVGMNDPEGFLLVDGFVNLIIQDELGGSFSTSGPTIPGVSVVGKSTGLIYTFALKAILPHIKL